MFLKTAPINGPRCASTLAVLITACIPLVARAQVPVPPPTTPQKETVVTPVQTPPVVTPEKQDKQNKPDKSAPAKKPESTSQTDEKPAGKPKEKVVPPASATNLPVVVVTVRRFRDAGGDTDHYKGPDGRPLTERLADALSRTLSENANDRYVVAGTNADVPKTAIRLIIESDLSAPDSVPENSPNIPKAASVMVAVAASFAPSTTPTTSPPSPPSAPTSEANGAGSRPYLLVTRIWREGKPRRLVAQFVGSAGSVRGLTGNLLGESDANLSGVIGSMAERIGKVVTAVQSGVTLNGSDSVVPPVGFAPTTSENNTTATPGTSHIKRARSGRPEKE